MSKKWFEFWKSDDPENEMISETMDGSPDYELNTHIHQEYINMAFGHDKDSPLSSLMLRKYIKNPFEHIEELRNAARWAYHSNGVVSAGIDYLRSMHTLDGVVVTKSRSDGTYPDNYQKNKAKMEATLNTIHYKQVIRDGLFCDANDGMYAAYFETKVSAPKLGRYLSDYDIENIYEINELGVNATVVPLPIDRVRIVGRRNNSYQIAFDLRYFDEMDERTRKIRLSAMPKEIQDGWTSRNNGRVKGDWLVLNNDKTIVTKIKSKITDPFGIPFAIAALDDISYAKYFIDTKRNVLDSVNHQIVYETFPEGKERGTSALTQPQQQAQHELVKNALMSRRTNTSGTSFFSLASGTKLDKITLDVQLLDEKNETAIKDCVNKDLGLSASALDGSASGNYSTATLNMELVAANVYTWIEDIVLELNKCINKAIIRDSSCVVNLYILPVTMVNRDRMVGYMNSLYSQGKGSLIAWIASTGFNPDSYISLMEYEKQEDFENRYPVHKTSFTMSARASSDQGGRPATESDNPSTIQTKTNGSNMMPKPSSG